MFLTQSDLEALTGYAQPGRQRRWLDSHHWIYENASNGRVVVSKAYAESRLSAWSSDGLLVRQIKTKKLQLFQRTPELEKVINSAKDIPRPFRGLFLICTSTGKMYSQSTVRDWWIEAKNAAGVHDVHFHDIRGKSATEAEADGEDYQALLGHSTKAMSDKYLKVERPQIVKPRGRFVESGAVIVERNYAQWHIKKCHHGE